MVNTTNLTNVTNITIKNIIGITSTDTATAFQTSCFSYGTITTSLL